MNIQKLYKENLLLIILYLILSAAIVRYNYAFDAVIALIVFAGAFYYVMQKIGKENLLIVTLPVQRIFIDIGFALKPFYLILILIFSLDMVKKAIEKQRNQKSLIIKRPDNFFLLCAIFILSICVATMMNGARIVSFRHIIVFIIVITASYMIYNSLNSFSDFRRLFNVYLLVGLLLGITGLLFYVLFIIKPALCAPGSFFEGVTYDSERPWSWPLLQSIEISSNGYGMTLLPFLFISAFRYKTEKKLSIRAFSAFVFLLLLLNLFLTFSRGGLFAFIGAWFSLYLMRLKSMKTWILLAATILILVVSWPMVMELYKYYSVLKGSDPTSEVVMLSNRDELFFTSLNIFLQHPLFGVGQGVIIEPEYVGKQSHNTYIELLAENGIFPFLIFVLILLTVVKRIYSVFKQKLNGSHASLFTPLFLSFVGILIAAIPTSAITSGVLWIHFAIIIAFYKVINNEYSNEYSIPDFQQ